MHTLEAMRRRIESAEDLHSVVRVMKALAAVNIRQFERAVESVTEYGRTVELGLQALLRQRPQVFSYTHRNEASRLVAVVFGSDQGMCGAFNEQIMSFSVDQLTGPLDSRPDCPVVVVGTRILGRVEDAGFSVADSFPVPGSVAGIVRTVEDLLLRLETLRHEQGIRRIVLYHHRPLPRGISQPTAVQMLPVDAEWLRTLARRPWRSRSLPTMSMDWRPLFSGLIRQHLFVTLYRALAMSLASENASRLASMQAAEKNIRDHLDELTARYHQQRQMSITEELLDIVAGFQILAAPPRNGRSDGEIRDETWD